MCNSLCCVFSYRRVREEPLEIRLREAGEHAETFIFLTKDNLVKTIQKFQLAACVAKVNLGCGQGKWLARLHTAR